MAGRSSGAGYNFTQHVRSVLQKSRMEAAALSHEYVGTEHILLALLMEPDSIAVAALKSLAVETQAVRAMVLDVVKKGRADAIDHQELPYSSRAKKVLELAMTEARALGHNYVGTEHLLLGLVREERGIAAQVLAQSGVALDGARREVVRLTAARGIEPIRGRTNAERPSAEPSSGAPEFRPWHSMTHELGYVVLWWTLGIVALAESSGVLVRQVTGTGDVSWSVALIAAAELVGAVLMLIRRSMRTGAKILLAVFIIAGVTRVAQGEFPGPVFVQAAATFFLLAEVTRGMRFRLRSDSRT